jgi:pimeloyl-ACP methyl ester carboxylesterase
VERISLVGLRLGGALAMLSAAESCDIDSLVLWDPVIRGSSHVEELKMLQAEFLRLGYVSSPRRNDAAALPDEVLGYPMTAELWEDLANIDLLSIDHRPANQVLLIESARPSGLEQAHSHLARSEVAVERQHIQEPRIWLAEPVQGIVPHQLLEAVVSWMLRVYP